MKFPTVSYWPSRADQYDDANLRTGWTPQPEKVRAQIEAAYQATMKLPAHEVANIRLRCVAKLAAQRHRPVVVLS